MPVRSAQPGPVLHGGPGRSASASRPTPAPGPRPASWTGRATRSGTALGAPLVTGALALAAVAHLAVTDPYRPGSHLACPVLALTGWYCAGCGGQRAVHSLAHGDLAAAWDMNPLLVVLAPVAVMAWLRWLGHAARARPATRRVEREAAREVARAVPRTTVRSVPSGRAAWLLLAAVVVFAVARNVPLLAPWLAP